jgi:hypothetical protein
MGNRHRASITIPLTINRSIHLQAGVKLLLFGYFTGGEQQSGCKKQYFTPEITPVERGPIYKEKQGSLAQEPAPAQRGSGRNGSGIYTARR